MSRSALHGIPILHVSPPLMIVSGDSLICIIDTRRSMPSSGSSAGEKSCWDLLGIQSKESQYNASPCKFEGATHVECTSPFWNYKNEFLDESERPFTDCTVDQVGDGKEILHRGVVSVVHDVSLGWSGTVTEKYLHEHPSATTELRGDAYHMWFPERSSCWLRDNRELLRMRKESAASKDLRYELLCKQDPPISQTPKKVRLKYDKIPFSRPTGIFPVNWRDEMERHAVELRSIIGHRKEREKDSKKGIQ